MNLHQLEIFCAVAEEKSFSSAAKKLFLTQPAVTMQVRLLEDTSGVKLIEKEGRNIGLTQAGKVLYSYAEHILNKAREAENVLADFRGLEKRLLKLDTSRQIAKYFLPKILAVFGEKYPKVNIHLRSGNSQEAVDRVLNFKSDIAIVGRVNYPDKLVVTPIFEDHVWLITSTCSGTFEKEEIELTRLDGKPLIMREEGFAIRKLILEGFEKEGIRPHIVMELGSVDTIKELVKEGIGLSILPWTTVKNEVRRNSLKGVRISGKKLIFDIVFHKSRRPSHLIKAFTNVAIEVLLKGNSDPFN